VKNIFLAVCFFLSCAGMVQAEQTVEVEGRYWFTDLDAKAKVTTSGLSGTDINLKSDLGLKDEDMPDFRLTWNINENNSLRFAYTSVEYDGDKNVTKTINFDGKTYTAGARVISALDLDYYRLGWIWEFLNAADDKVDIGLLTEIKGFSVKAKLDAPGLSISESEDFEGALPALGLTCAVDVYDNFEVNAEISGMTAGSYGYLYDAEIGVKWEPYENFAIEGGYRVLEIKGEDDSDFAKVSIDGPYLGALFSF